MNNKKMKIAVIALSIALAVLLPVTVLVVSAATTGDPLILFTKDYFDSKVLPELNKKNSEQDQNIDSLNTKYTTLLAQYAALADKVAAITGQGEVTVSRSGFLEVKLEKNQTLVPAGTNAQCLEVILKRGDAQVISPYNHGRPCGCDRRGGADRWKCFGYQSLYSDSSFQRRQVHPCRRGGCMGVSQGGVYH